MVVEMPHPTMGTVRLLGLPVKFSETPVAIHRHPPLFAEHTDEILRELGLSDTDLARLRESGVINSGHGAAVPTGD
jgi:formyl-CoA transferase